MRPIVVTVTGVGNSAPIPLDTNGEPQCALQAVVSGTATYTVEQTLDDPYGSGALNWFNHPDANLVGATTSAQSNYAFVPRACRLAVTAGTGIVTLTVIQAGSGQI